jgi:phosphate transport system substrate-binding protein
MNTVKLSVSVLALVAASATAATARDQVQVAGSSTVLPYSTIAAEAFGENTDFPTPVIESGGSSAGLKKFCEGVDENTIDIANSSRAIRPAEIEVCAANGVTDIIEVRIGYDGIVFASDVNGADFALTAADVYKAAAAMVPVDGKLVANPYTKWSEVNSALPDQEIQLFVPGTKHGTREVFETKVIEAGCVETGAEDILKAEKGDDKDAIFKGCIDLRTDGRSVDIDGDYTETLARLDSNKTSVGVFGLSFYENNTDKLKVATMEGVVPSTETISSAEYPVSRPLYFYIKKAHIGVVPGVKEFAEFFVSDDLAGPDGPLAAYGLVADPELASVQATVADEVVMGK